MGDWNNIGICSKKRRCWHTSLCWYFLRARMNSKTVKPRFRVRISRKSDQTFHIRMDGLGEMRRIRFRSPHTRVCGCSEIVLLEIAMRVRVRVRSSFAIAWGSQLMTTHLAGALDTYGRGRANPIQ